MARTSIQTLLTLLAILFISSEADDTFHKTLNPNELGLKKQKLSHLHFFFHDITVGKNQTTALSASASTSNTSHSGFGKVVMMDDPLTVGPELGSEKIGAAQGIYAFASHSEVALLMVHTYVFTEGKFNGSTLSVLGRNAGIWSIREFPIVGGSGIFRFARGYALAKTLSFDPATGNSVMEYNVYVFHY